MIVCDLHAIVFGQVNAVYLGPIRGPIVKCTSCALILIDAILNKTWEVILNDWKTTLWFLCKVERLRFS